MSKLLISPNLMFQFATQVRKLESTPAKSAQWKLAPSHAMPDLTKWLLGATLKFDLRLGWSESGIYLQMNLPLASEPAESSNLRFWIDTRGAVANKRFTKFCHLIEYRLAWRSMTVTQSLTCGKLDSKQDDEPSKTSIQSLVTKSSDGVELKSFVPTELLQGFQPKEFPQISYFYDYGSDTQPKINAGTDSRVRYDMDPSVWILARLV